MFRFLATGGILLALLASALFAVEAPEAGATRPFTVVTFGDSTTALRNGVEVYTTQLERRFPGVRFLNRGVGGNTTEHARKRFEHDVVEEHPNLLIAQFGMNDSAIDVWKTPPAERARVPLVEYERNLREFVTTVQRWGGTVILMTPNQRRWSPILRKHYARPPYDPNNERGLLILMGDYVDAVQRVARDLKSPLVDVYALYDRWEQSTGRSCSELMLDGQHPNTAGQKLVADALEPEIKQVLSGAGARNIGASSEAPPPITDFPR